MFEYLVQSAPLWMVMIALVLGTVAGALGMFVYKSNIDDKELFEALEESENTADAYREECWARRKSIDSLEEELQDLRNENHCLKEFLLKNK